MMNKRLTHHLSCAAFSFRNILLTAFTGLIATVNAQPSEKTADIVRNDGQWGNQVHAWAGISGGDVYFSANRLHFDRINADDLAAGVEYLHEHPENPGESAQSLAVRRHYYQVELLGANPEALPDFRSGHTTRYNYFRGNASEWRTNVPSYGEIRYASVYNGIDVVYRIHGTDLKYDFIVHPGSNAGAIQLRYSAVDAVRLENERLVIVTSAGEQRECIPLAWQEKNGERITVPCSYRLVNNTVTFRFPEGYDRKLPLVIDPLLMASTNSGSTATIFGCTSTYDNNGNIFLGGYGYAPGGLPTTPGAYQSNFAGMQDICINKYSPDGLGLLFSTYIGGSQTDYPKSMVTDANGDLYISGTTYSGNFPVTAGSFQNVFGGGQTDITLCHLSSDGTTMIGSTFVGGNGIDGEERGQIALAQNGDVLLVSQTYSVNFPVTAGAFQASFAGIRDGLILRILPDMSALVFSTFIGGNNFDSANSIIEAPDGTLYITGSARSAGFVFPNTPASPEHANVYEAFIVRLSSDGQTLLAGTYAGDFGNSQSYFIQLDTDANVLIVLMADQPMSSSPGKYQGPGDKRTAIMKFSGDLETREWISSIKFLTPTAFFVDLCDRIYLSGSGIFEPGHEVTPNAESTAWKGIYTMSLTREATSLIYATYYGTEESHVHEGTSHFDGDGILYQATCSIGDFPAAPHGRYSGNQTVNGTSDMTVFKLDFEPGPSEAGIFLPSQTVYVCNGLPQAVSFTGVTDAITHYWSFGDGSTSTEQNPTHQYANYGNYTVVYYPESGSPCFYYDTVTATVSVIETQPVVSDYTLWRSECNDTLFLQLDFTGSADQISWNMGDGNVLTTQDPFSYFYVNPGQYTIQLTAFNTLCNTSDSDIIPLYHSGLQSIGEVFMPNVFTANGDGINEIYRLSSDVMGDQEIFDALSSYELKIVNRWGNTVFESIPDNQATWFWDGKSNGLPVEEGVYFYTLKYADQCMEKPIELSGFVHVMR